MSNNRKDEPVGKEISHSRSDKLKEIDLLYRQQIKKIYHDNKATEEEDDVYATKGSVNQKREGIFKKQVYSLGNNLTLPKKLQSPNSSTTFNLPESQTSSKMFNSGNYSEDRVRASVFLKGESTRTIELLRRENESKELKNRQLSHQCENLVQKLKDHLSETQFSQEMESLRQFSDGKMERLQHLFKIKHEEIFFKIKLQVIGLLQEFGVVKEELAEFNDVSSESNLFIMMTRKLKTKLKDFRSQQKESSFELQKDKIVSQKQEERIHYLTETNELLKLSESKLKSKIEDLKFQLNQYLDRIRLREQDYESKENEAFRLQKQKEELQSINQKLNAAMKVLETEKASEKRVWEAKEKEMKILLNNYFIEKKKLEADLEEKDEDVEELIIKYKFLEQENERMSRELIRWKERYEWIQKEKQVKTKEAEEERNIILTSFEEYKLEFNQGVMLDQRGEVDEAIRKIEEYQRAYERVGLELEEESRLLRRSEEQAQERLIFEEKQWLERFKALEKIKEEQLFEVSQENEERISQLRDEYEKKEELLAEQLQAKLRALLAERDKKTTEQFIQMETQNDQLRRQIGDLNRIVQVKESLINVINSKSL